ncbi:hypothetical protein PtA15_2A78 [Puccinia triticina]|uniref:Uncharacterized protein n=1 Tax=Puccinia triticina TaxID=208348 RepID=A0ABY7CCX2_9BASI|nr:uncharacterized protein PtA15_2A78 [Puccinia triticina]WAQ81767.1 hypothetical protein PtA15_2A78 [Puccinia triticina]
MDRCQATTVGSRNGSVPQPINNHQYLLYVKDSVPSNQKPINLRFVDVAHLKTYPLIVVLLNNHLINHLTS